MREFVLTEFGATPQLTDIDVPEPGEGEVRVRVHAASVNGFDLAVANGYVKDMLEHRFPVVLGKDFAGVVDAVGPGVRDYQVGDRVFGVVTKAHVGDGSFAVGNQAVQLAKIAGTTVTATAATHEEKSLVTNLGADTTVDHRSDLAQATRQIHPDGVDVVLHFAGDPEPLLGLVRRGGRFVSTIVQPQQLPTDDATVIGIYVRPDAATLDRLATHAAQGATRLTVQQTFPLHDAPDAFAAFTAGTLGKIVVTVA